MKLINIFGGPGIGKSTISADLYVKLKNSNVNCELVREYAKDLVWHERSKCLEDQVYVTAKQYHDLFMLKSKVDVCITDSPIMLGVYYNKLHSKHNKEFNDFIFYLHNTFKNQLNVLLKRKKKYNVKGRIQTEDEAIKIDNEIELLLKQYNIPYIELDGDDICSEMIKYQLITDGSIMV